MSSNLHYELPPEILQDRDIDLLPGSMVELVDVIGLPAVLKLMDAFGGTELWVPKRLAHDHPLVEALGAEAAQCLVEHAPCENIRVPRGAGIIREVRNRAIRRERRAGALISELALRYQLTERQVLTILHSEPADDRQQDLFE